MKKLVLLTLVVAALSSQAFGLEATNISPTSWTLPGGQNPLVTTARLPINSSDGNTPYVSEGNWGSGASRVGQTFIVPQDCKLDKIAVIIAGADTTVICSLFDLGTGQNNWNQPASLDLVNYMPSLIGTPYYHFWGAAGDSMAVLDFEGSEEAQLLAGHKYLFVFSLSSGGTMYTKRTGAPVDYPGVSLYIANGATTMTTLRGDAARNWGLALYIPEPATIALLGLGLTLLRKRS